MSYVSGFQHDLFVSYAHLDNEPFGEKSSCWVTEFHRNLQTRLGQLVGDAVSVWRDPRLEGSEVLWETLHQRLGEAAVLISILSPRYLESQNCRDELEYFARAAQETGGLMVGTRKRLLKVLKTLVPLEKHPDLLRDLVGCEFYREDKATGRAREFHLDPSPSAQLEYWARLDDLAYDIRAVLQAIQSARTVAAGPGTQNGPAVYLADTSSDLRQERDQVMRDLKSRGCRVLPAAAPPLVAEEFRSAVREDLEMSKLSVHLIGGYYGAIPEGDSQSVIELEYHLANERAQRGGFSQVIWMSKTLVPREDRQKQLIETLEAHSSPRDDYEVFKTGIEDLKDCIQEKLTPKRTPAPAPAAPAAVRQIYLICDTSDFGAPESPDETLGAFRDYLFDAGCEVTLPLRKGEPEEIRLDHEDNLRQCHTALIYWGRGTESWLRAKLRELTKAPALGRSTPLRAFIYITGPRSPEKDALRSHQPFVRAYDGFRADDLTELLS